ncbi:MAG: radical SAM family heme chaperone HemW [Pyrinomonadaceae bacterium]
MSAGVYIHIPFCKSRCSYCDFATDVYRDEERVETYVDALASEILSDPRNAPIDTIYFGGGTPSLLSPKQLEKIVGAIETSFKIKDGTEFTLEMNPATVTPDKLKDFRSLGVNRASFGVQTFDDRDLRLLARGHDSADALHTFRMLRQAGFENISFDLIAALPGQTIENWRGNLEKAISLSPEHLSLYLLEVHPETPLAAQLEAGRRAIPDEDLAGEMYQILQDEMESAGYEQYEISNFSRPGFASRHNTKYWMLEPVFGYGVSAHSFDGKNKRHANARETDDYLKLIETLGNARTFLEELSTEQLIGEFSFLRLRMSRGFTETEFEDRFGIRLPVRIWDELRHFEDLGITSTQNGVLRLTKKGMLFSNEVFSSLV